MVQILKEKLCELFKKVYNICFLKTFFGDVFVKILNNEIMHFILRKWDNALKFWKSDPDDCILDGTTANKSVGFYLHGATCVKFEMYISIKYYLN